MSHTEDMLGKLGDTFRDVDENLKRVFVPPPPEQLPDEILNLLSKFDALEDVATDAASTNQVQHSARDAANPYDQDQNASPVGLLRNLFQRCESALPRTRRHKR